MTRYLFNEKELESEIVILFSIVNSSKTNHEFLEDYVEKGVILDIYPIERTIIQKYLISIAIKTRIIIDILRGKKIINEIPLDCVGRFIEGSDSDTLSFREACNKIIHATKLEGEFVEANLASNCSRYNNHYIPILCAYGKKCKREWAVEIEVRKFLLSALALVHVYDEDCDD